jgi:flagellar basal-body rod protein FlgB
VLNPVYLLDLAAQHARWASTRQATITGNIANANTTGYTALDVEPFSAVLDGAGSLQLAVTAPGHLGATGGPAGEEGGLAVQDSGAPVSLDQELVKADETDRGFSLDTTIMRAFQRMMLAAVRSGA